MFNTTELANDQVLVTGEDNRGTYGEQVLPAGAYFERKRKAEIDGAHAAFDAEVEAFFAPITEAADKLALAHQIDLDPLLYVVEQEASDGRPAQEKVVVRLDNASVILRAIENGNHDRLLWVNGELVVTAAPVPPLFGQVEDPEPVEDTVPDNGGVQGEGSTENPSTSL